MSDILVTALTTQELYHHGIEGQKWGERRYQNYDGSLTEEGRKRYGVKEYRADKKAVAAAKREGIQAAYNYQKSAKKAAKSLKKAYDKEGNLKSLSENQTKKLLRDLSAKAYFSNEYQEKLSNAIDMTKSAKEKYGDTKIKDLKVKAQNVGGGNKEYLMYGSVLTGKDFVTAAAETIGMSALLAPVGMAYIAIPSSESKKKYTYMQDYKAWLKKYNSNDQSIPRAAARVDDPYASENGYAVFKRS